MEDMNRRSSNGQHVASANITMNPPSPIPVNHQQNLVNDLQSLKDQFDKRRQSTSQQHGTTTERKIRERKRRSSAKKSNSDTTAQQQHQHHGDVDSVRPRSRSKSGSSRRSTYKSSSMMNELELHNDRLKNGLNSILKRIEKQQLS